MGRGEEGVGRGEEGEGGVRKVGGGEVRLMQVAEDAARREDGRTGRGSGHTTGAEAHLSHNTAHRTD